MTSSVSTYELPIIVTELVAWKKLACGSVHEVKQPPHTCLSSQSSGYGLLIVIPPPLQGDHTPLPYICSHASVGAAPVPIPTLSFVNVFVPGPQAVCPYVWAAKTI